MRVGEEDNRSELTSTRIAFSAEGKRTELGGFWIRLGGESRAFLLFFGFLMRIRVRL